MMQYAGSIIVTPKIPFFPSTYPLSIEFAGCSIAATILITPWYLQSERDLSIAGMYIQRQTASNTYIARSAFTRSKNTRSLSGR